MRKQAEKRGVSAEDAGVPAESKTTADPAEAVAAVTVSPETEPAAVTAGPKTAPPGEDGAVAPEAAAPVKSDVPVAE